MASAPSLPPQWDAAGYAANSTVQLDSARTLISRLALLGDETVLDLGCGDGKVSAELAQAVPRGKVLGVDISVEMIAFANRHHGSPPPGNLRFQIGDAGSIGRLAPPATFDLIFSNAALHWVKDHPAVLAGAAQLLRPGGRLAISCGGWGNAHAVYLAMRPIMRSPAYRSYFRQMATPYFFYPLENYNHWLPAAGFRVNRLEMIPHDVTYAGAAGLAMWLRMTWLPFTQRVPAPLREDFIQGVTQQYLASHPPTDDGLVPVRLVRLELEATRL
ncbi:MAG TPA: methyltransferase domain-containing protein [Verrucomicrobiae bacterium]